MPDPILLEPPSLDELILGESVALFLDFDGTLVDIAATPDSISIPAELANSLERLAEKMSGRLAIVSGRSLADLRKHLGPLRLACAGSHGIERLGSNGMPAGPPAQPLPDTVVEALAEFAQAREGLGFENKRFGAALHFRSTPELGAETIALAEQVAAGAGLVLKHGSCVVELVHEGADKSAAVRAFMQMPPFRGATPVFVGDDLTDEDGFRAAAELGGFGIIVGNREPTIARYRLDLPASVRDWLML